MKVLLYDIETIKGCFLLTIYFPEEDKYCDFLINQYQNDIDGMVTFCSSLKEYYWVSYNGLSFDSQVIEYILERREDWFDKTGLEIADLIWRAAQDRIDDSNFGLFPEYRESELSFKQIDLFKLAHYDNKNRMVSLKRLMFEMDMENIEEFSIDHRKINFSKEEVENLVKYCHNDCYSLYKFYKYITGDTSHPLYAGNNQIQLRLDIEAEFGIRCLNYSNAKIGDEIIKKYYADAKNVTLAELPKKGYFRKSIALKNCIPDIISFKTEQLQEFLRKIKKQNLKMSDDFRNEIEFYGQKYTFAKGGLHNTIKGKIYKSDDEYILKDVDVSGFYPASIINYSFYPYHLGKEFLIGYTKVYKKRIKLKPLAKKDSRIKGIVAALKEAGNCPFGKSGDMTSWMFDKQMLLSTTLTGQLCILMLIEDCELNGIKCIMANTDGATFIIKRTEIEKFNKIREAWVEKTVNTINFELEEVDFKKIIFSTVNDYLAVKEDGSTKEKGDFLIDFELHKNKSKKIVPLALKEYFINGTKPEDFISNHKNIHDFCIRQKASRDFHYEGISKNGTTVYNKLIRYYVSTTGEQLFKIKNPNCQTNAPARSIVEKNEDTGRGNFLTVCNYLPKTIKVEDCNIDFQYYIDKAYRIINKIKLEGKKGVKKVPINQLKLF